MQTPRHLPRLRALASSRDMKFVNVPEDLDLAEERIKHEAYWTTERINRPSIIARNWNYIWWLRSAGRSAIMSCLFL